MDTTTGQIERYVTEAVNAGVEPATIDGFLRTNPDRYDQLWQLYTGPESLIPSGPVCACFHAPCTCDGTYWPGDTDRPGSDTGTVGEQLAAAVPAAAQAVSPVVVLGVLALGAFLLWK